MKKLALLALVALAPTAAQAAVVLNMAIGVLYKADGVTPLDANSTLVLLCDADNDGFGDLAQATDSWTADAGDIVAAIVPTDNLLGVDGSAYLALTVDVAGVTAGKPLMLAWYDLPFDASASGPGQGIAFGAYRTDDVVNYSEIAWFVPADGATSALNFTTVNGYGELAESVGVANMVTVPEPVTMSLLAVGGLLLARRRRA